MHFDTDAIADYVTRIRAAYRHLANPGELVSLTDLRPMVGGHRGLVDAALTHLGRQNGVSIVPESNQKMLTAWDRAAAVRIGSQDKHLISIT